MPLRLAVISLVGALSGCAAVSTIAPGSSTSDVTQRWGQPDRRDRSAAGERWIYTTLPEGRQVWRFDFDTGGRLLRQSQGLTLAQLSQIHEGMQQTAVEHEIGPSYWSLRYPYRPDELVHVYRFLADTIPMCFYVGYGDDGLVKSTGMQPEDRSNRSLHRPC